MKKLLFATLILSLILQLRGGYLYALGPGTTTASFLKITVGGRNAAMGETGSVPEDVNAIYWNPSGLAKLEGFEVSMMHSKWLEEINYEHLAIGYPTKVGIFGLAVNYLSMDEIQKYDLDDMPLNERYSPQDLALTLSYSRRLNDIPLGINLKYISSRLENESATAYAIDLGGIYDKLEIAKRRLQVGLALQNLGTKMKFVKEEDPLPMNIRLGISYPFLKTPQHHLITSLDLNKPVDYSLRLNFGTEYSRRVLKGLLFSGRLGYRTNIKGLGSNAGLTAGIGFRFKENDLDFAWVPYGDLGDTYRVSLTLRFGSKAKED